MPMNPRLMRPVASAAQPVAAAWFFYGDVDSDWQTLGNWWNDDGSTVPAASLPLTTANVTIRANITNSGSAPTVKNLLVQRKAASFSYTFPLNITVTETAEFYQGAMASGDVTASLCKFYGGSIAGTVSAVAGTVTADCEFYGDAGNNGNITGNCTFNDTSLNYYGTIFGQMTFNDSSFAYNTVGSLMGKATFNDLSINYTTITGDATFSGSSQNQGHVTKTATFLDSACNSGTAGTFDPDPPPSC